MSRKVNMGLIGAGRIGRLHAENLAMRIPEAHLVAVADINLEAARQVAAELGIAHAFQAPEAIMEDDDIQAVVICSSTHTHAPLIQQAAAAGKHIFCEKPIDRDLAVIDRALAAVQRGGVKLQVGFNRRFDPNFRRVRELVASGELGEPHILRITSRDPAPPPMAYVQVSGGIFMDMTIHDFDMARYLMGSEVQEVYALGNVLVDPQIGEAGDIDTAIVTLRFANGALGTIDNSRQAVYGYDQRVEVFGSQGVAVAENKRANDVAYSNVHGTHAALPLYFFVERYTEAYIAELSAFAQSILQDTDPPVTGLDGRAPVVMAYAAQKSYLEGRPVPLAEVEQDAKGKN